MVETELGYPKQLETVESSWVPLMAGTYIKLKCLVAESASRVLEEIKHSGAGVTEALK
jgi:hypothetical protein